MNNDKILIKAIYTDTTMAIYTLETLLNTINNKDNKIKNDIANITSGYKRYEKDCKKLAKDLKLTLKEESTMKKMAAKMGITEIVKKDNSDPRIADMLIKGISMGSLDIEKQIKNNDEDLSRKVKKLAKDFYEFQKDNMTALKKYL